MEEKIVIESIEEPEGKLFEKSIDSEQEVKKED